MTLKEQSTDEEVQPTAAEILKRKPGNTAKKTMEVKDKCAIGYVSDLMDLRN